MKKTILLSVILVIALIRNYGNGFEIKIFIPHASYDSLFIQSYDFENQWQVLYALPSSPAVVFKSKEKLNPGIFILSAGREQILTHFLISDTERQTFEIHIDEHGTRFRGSPENSANTEYIRKMQEFEEIYSALDKQFRKMQASTLAQAARREVVDSLVREVEITDNRKSAFQQEIISGNQGTLLASIVRASLEMKNPPKEYFTDKKLMEGYYTAHFFDHFPWEDERLMTTPVAYNKFRHFTMLLLQMDSPQANIFLSQTLRQIHPYPFAYRTLFGFLEEFIGSQSSPYWREDLYITMLKDAVACLHYGEPEKIRYKAVLLRLDKNHPGTVLPNFTMIVSSGDTIDLYSIDAEYMLLDLQNPDCPTCKELMEKLDGLKEVRKAIEEKRLKVLTVYFEEDEKLWRDYLVTANPDYIHGWDFYNRIEKEKLFDTEMIPYMFLLDKDKRVIKKDIYWDEIENYIQK